MAAATSQIRQDDTFLSEADKQAVRDQLDRIIASRLFRDTTRMKRFLRYVTEQALENKADRLKGYTIGIEVFDRPDDFDPQADTIVRVQAGQLRRRLDLYYAGDGQGDPIRLTVPKGRYAPSFEFRSQPGTDAVPDTPKPMLTLLERSHTAIQRPGLAVFTLEDLTDSDRRDFFAEGLTAELVSALVQFRHLRIVAVRPSVKERTAEEHIRKVGEEFNVQFVLTGNVRRAGDVFRVSVNLIETKTGRVQFSRTFDRQYTADNLFEIQESISSNVAAAIAAPYGQINRHNWRLLHGRRNSISAYETVLRFYGMGTTPSLKMAKDLLHDVEELTREHKDFSTGFAIRAMLHVLQCTQCIPCGDKRENLDAAQDLAGQAIILDGQNAVGFFAAFQAYFHDGQLERAEELGQRAMALNPNDYMMLSYFSLTQAMRGEQELSEAYDEAARRLIGLPPRWFWAAKYARALAKEDYQLIVDELVDVTHTDTISFWFQKVAALGHLGRAGEGMALFKSLNARKGTTAADWMRTAKFWQAEPTLEARYFDGWRKVGLDI